MRYQASWRYTSGLGILAIVIGACVILAGILLRQLVLIAIGFLILLYLLMIGRRLYVEFFPDRFVYQGWLKKREIRTDEVLSIRRAHDLNWPRNRIYGPLTYEIRTSATRFFINPLYFGPDFSRRFQERFATGIENSEKGMRGKIA